MFAPAVGIKRTNEGKIVVDNEIVKQQKEAEQEASPPKVVRQVEEPSKPV